MMKIARLAFALLFASSVSMLLAQSPVVTKDSAPASNEPIIADVQPSPYRATIFYDTNIGEQRFDMRDATMLDMITLAYKRENDAIIGGPTWIDFDHFDVIGKLASLKPTNFNVSQANSANPPVNPYDQIRPFLQRVLAERFHLVYNTEQRPLPGYVVTLAKGGSKLTEAKDPTAQAGCQGSQDKATPNQYTVTCTSQTMANFLSSYGGIFPHPAVDRTGLTKAYDFTFTIAYGNLRTRDDYVRLYIDIFNKQLGLLVAPADVPQPAIVVDTVDRTPTPNVPDIAKLIPVQPDLEFEVATIKPSADDEPREQIRPIGSQITFSAFNLQGLITRAWQLPTGAVLGDALPLLPPARYTILVKLPLGMDARNMFQNQDQFDNMLKKLVIDRFEIKYHWGERKQQDAYVLLAGTPKMKKADPNSRSFCKYGAPEGEKDVRTADSPYDHEFYCRNVTMAQFADLAQPLAGSEIKNRVPDKTGLAGSYDFTLFYTSKRKLRADTTAAAAAAVQAGDAVTAPVAGDSVEDAFRKQLGLRLEKQPLTLPALILDHFDQAPTDN
jgi:uncharacterized protein (TIGR03435 family)